MLEIIFLVLIIIAIVAVSVYFFVDFSKHKDENITDFNKVRSDIVVEQETRASNLASIVQQVNDVNMRMDADHKASIKGVDDNVKDITDKYNSFETGFGYIIQTTDKTTGSAVPLTAAIESTPVDLQLMKHVSVVSGMTIKDLDNDKRMKACGTGTNATRCIEFPNDTGDTYLTSLVEDGSIVAAAPLKTQGIDTTGSIKLHTANNMEYMTFSEESEVSQINATKKLKLTAPMGIEASNKITLKNDETGGSATLEIDATTGALNITAKTLNIRATEDLNIAANALNITTTQTENGVKINGTTIPTPPEP